MFPDFQALKEHCCKNKLCGTIVSVHHVPVATSIQVHGVDTHNEQYVELYLESRKHSGGGPLKAVDKHTEKGYMIVQYEHRHGKDQTCTHLTLCLIEECSIHL